MSASNKTSSKKWLLFFTPFARIWEHTIPEAIVAKKFQNLGREVEYITCDLAIGNYRSFGLPDKAELCIR